MIYLSRNERLPIARQSESDFVVPLIVDALASADAVDASDEIDTQRRSSTEDAEHEWLIGRMWAERWDVGLSLECGFTAEQIGDGVSAVWCQVVETLLRTGGRFRSELQIDSFVSEILLLHELLLHPAIEPRVAVGDAMLRCLTGTGTLVLMQYEQGEPHHLEDREYCELGFRKIARSNLLIKDCSLRYPFAERFPAARWPSRPARNTSSGCWKPGIN